MEADIGDDREMMAQHPRKVSTTIYRKSNSAVREPYNLYKVGLFGDFRTNVLASPLQAYKYENNRRYHAYRTPVLLYLLRNRYRSRTADTRIQVKARIGAQTMNKMNIIRGWRMSFWSVLIEIIMTC